MKFSAAGANLATQNDPQQQLSNIRIPRHLLRNPGKTYLLYQVSLTLLFLFNNRHFVPPRLLLPRVVALADSFAFVRGSSSITSRVAKRGTTTSTTFTHTKPISFLSSVVLRGGGLRSSSNTMAKESSSSNSYTVTNNDTIASPPTIWRDEERFVLVGNVTESSSSTTSMRQSEESKNPLVDPPVAVPDPYGWMRDDDRTSEKVLNHLRAENAYTEQVVASCQELKDTIYQDFLRYIQETDYTTPAMKNNYIYYERTFEGKSYSVHCRAPLLSKTNNDFYTIAQGWDKSANTTILPGEQVLLDENQLAEGKSHCHVGSVQVSPSGTLLAYTLDETGGEKYKLIVQNIETKEDHILAVPLEDIDSTILWGPDDTSLYYLRFDDTHRPFQVYKHILSPSPSSTENLQQDQLLFQEDDELFWVSIDKSQDEKFLFIDSSSKETSEVHFIDLFNNRTTTTTNLDVVSCVSKRRTKVLYSVEHYKGSFLIATNVGGTTNMRFMVAPTLEFSEDSWVDVTRTNSSSDSDILFTGGTEKCLEAVHVFESHVVLSGREDGMPSLWVAQFEDDHNSSSSSSSSKVHSFWKLEFDEDVHDVCLGSNYEYLTDSIVINYESLITPTQSILTQLKDPNNERRIVKEKNIPGFDKSLYSCERFTVPSRDGTPIPVSMVYRKGTIPNNGINWREQSIGETVNVHLYGYGSYGMCVEADFRSSRFALIDRGIVYAIAHVRGGGEMGRQWYEEPNGAKYLCKKNTFNDFVDVARFLVDKNLTDPAKLSCEGRSAGGLLIGAVINQAPELFKVAILGVPFVDVVVTMIDATIPLTTAEWEEWGNPNEEKFFNYMMSYSPINNVKKAATYPACLLTGGLHDPRVQYWEPAKFAAELRYWQGKDSGPICLKLDMAAGHFSASDRYKYLKELAFDYAFLISQLHKS